MEEIPCLGMLEVARPTGEEQANPSVSAPSREQAHSLLKDELVYTSKQIRTGHREEFPLHAGSLLPLVKIKEKETKDFGAWGW